MRKVPKDKVFFDTVEKTGYSEEKVEFLILWFWKTIYFYLKNPLYTGLRIIVKDAFYIRMRFDRLGLLYRKYETLVETKGKNQYLRWNQVLYLSEVIKFVLKYDKKGQARKFINNGRSEYDKRSQTWERKKSLEPGSIYDWSEPLVP